MKILLKTIPRKYQLNIDEVFLSPNNKQILNKLILELERLLAPAFTPTRKEIWDWLGALHRHQRGRHLKVEQGKIDEDNRRLHANNRMNEV